MKTEDCEEAEKLVAPETEETSTPNPKRKKLRIVAISITVGLIAAVLLGVGLVLPNLGPSNSTIQAELEESFIVKNGVLLNFHVNDSPYEIVSLDVTEKNFEFGSHFGTATCSLEIENQNFHSSIVLDLELTKDNEGWKITEENIQSESSSPLKGVDQDVGGNDVGDREVFDKETLTSTVTNEISKTNWMASFSGIETEVFRFSELTGWEFEDFSVSVTSVSLLNADEEFTTNEPFNVDGVVGKLISSSGNRNGSSLKIIDMTPSDNDGLTGSLEVELSWYGTRQTGRAGGDNYASLIESRANGGIAYEDFTESATYSGEYSFIAESLFDNFDYSQLGVFDLQKTSSDGKMPDSLSGTFNDDQTIECGTPDFAFTVNRVNKA